MKRLKQYSLCEVLKSSCFYLRQIAFFLLGMDLGRIVSIDRRIVEEKEIEAILQSPKSLLVFINRQSISALSMFIIVTGITGR
jgi:hypothetical protein